MNFDDIGFGAGANHSGSSNGSNSSRGDGDAGFGTNGPPRVVNLCRFLDKPPRDWSFAKKPPVSDKPIEKKPYLRKGAGLARYYKGFLPEINTNDQPQCNNSLKSGRSCSKYKNNGSGRSNGVCKEYKSYQPTQSDYTHELTTDDPYLEMDSSFTGSGSIHKDSFTEDEDEDAAEVRHIDPHISQHMIDNNSKVRQAKSPVFFAPAQNINEYTDEEYELGEPMDQPNPKSDKELQLFELLEKIAEERSLCSTSSVVNKFVNTRFDISPVPQDHNSNNLTGSSSITPTSTCTNTARSNPGGDKNNPMSPEVLQRVLELVRNDAEKSNRISMASHNKSPTEFQAALLTARTMELEVEIKKYREENKNVAALREQWQFKCDKVEDDQKQFDQLKDRELRLIEDEKARLNRKKERLNKLIADQEAKAAEFNNANVGVEERLERLRLSVYGLEKEGRAKDKRLKAVQNRFEHENKTLREKYHRLKEQFKLLPDDLQQAMMGTPPIMDVQVPTSRATERSNKARVYSEAFTKKAATGRVSVSVSTNTTPELGNISASEEEPIYNMPSSPQSSSFLSGRSSNGQHEELVQQKISHSEAKKGVETILPNGDRETKYPNGTKKIQSSSSRCTRTLYYNGDIRESKGDGSIRYFYNESSTWHTTYPDGLEVLEFPSGQIERKHTNGVIEIIYGNGCIKHIYPCGKEECIFSDQTILRTERNGDKVLLLPNGQKEYQTKDFRKRIYPDGTTKIVYSDGSQETRYANGRVRMKDSKGKLIHDAIHPKDSKSSPTK